MATLSTPERTPARARQGVSTELAPAPLHPGTRRGASIPFEHPFPFEMPEDTEFFPSKEKRPSDSVRGIGSRTNPFATSSTAAVAIKSEPADIHPIFIFIFNPGPTPTFVAKDGASISTFIFNFAVSAGRTSIEGRPQALPRGGDSCGEFVPVWTYSHKLGEWA